MLAFYGSCVKADVVVSIILEQRVAGVDVQTLPVSHVSRSPHTLVVMKKLDFSHIIRNGIHLVIKYPWGAKTPGKV